MLRGWPPAPATSTSPNRRKPAGLTISAHPVSALHHHGAAGEGQGDNEGEEEEVEERKLGLEVVSVSGGSESEGQVSRCSLSWVFFKGGS